MICATVFFCDCGTSSIVMLWERVLGGGLSSLTCPLLAFYGYGRDIYYWGWFGWLAH